MSSDFHQISPKPSTQSVNLSHISSSLLLLSSHPAPAPLIRYTILALYKFICMYVKTLTASKHRFSPYNAHYVNYNFFIQFPVPVPYEYEIYNYDNTQNTNSSDHAPHQ